MVTMNELPPELQGFTTLLEVQSTTVREAFHFCLCLLMTEAGVMRLVEALPGDGGMVYQFETSLGERYVVSRPPMSEAQEAELLEVLRQILAEEGGPG